VARRVTAFLNVVSHPDLAVARRLGRTVTGAFARSSAMDGQVRTPTDEVSERELLKLSSAYDMRKHGAAAAGAATHAGILSDDFIERFGVVGDARHCIARIREVVELGLDRIVIVCPTAVGDRDSVAQARAVLTHEVLPALKAIQQVPR
jgi:5,10-methylenetetrahydromethanopterin reductase